MIYFAHLMDTTDSAFYKYFQEVYGETRWPKLFEAIKAPDQKVARLNPYLSYIEVKHKTILDQKYLDEQEARQIFQNDQEAVYYLDLASLLPPLALAPKVGQSCLDMCAAPGGKTLVLAALMAHDEHAEIELIANEISLERRSRLIRVLKEQLPEKIFRQIKITNHDGSKWCLYQKNYFDKILLDAPCSGERYFVQEQKEISSWTKKRSQNMGARQFALVASAFECLNPQGELVYSTCSISPFENDEVINKLLKKRKGRVEVLQFESPLGEKTEHGWQILPDQFNGFGPIYFAKLKRLD